MSRQTLDDAKPGESPSLPAVADLSAILDRQKATLETLLRVAEAKREAILKNDVAAIESAVEKESRLLDALSQWEQRRLDWARRWSAGQEARTLRGDGGDLTLRRIAAGLPENTGKVLEKTADTLSELVQKLDDVNRQNAGLLYHSLAYVQTVLAALTGAEQRGGIYGPNSSGKNAPGRTIVDWRA